MSGEARVAGTSAVRVPVRQGLFDMDPPALLGSRCGACGAVAFPGRTVCPECLAWGMDRVRLSGRGRIEAFTVVRVSAGAFRAPYLQAAVRLEEGPELIAVLTGCPTDDPPIAPGTPVEMALEPLTVDPAGHEVVALKFRPLSGGAHA